jgi:hypothetical protein
MSAIDPAGPAFIGLKRYHREWLGARGLLDRPWLILGSAPQPTIPSHRPAGCAYVYVKYAGRSAKRHGLPPADLTFTTVWQSSDRMKDIAVDNIIWLRPKLGLAGRVRRAFGLRATRISDMLGRERDAYVMETLGSLFAQEERRPSNGIGLISFALAQGVPQIIIAGISVDVAGHEYDDLKRRRRHSREDIAALKRVAERYPFVSTTERRLSEETGLPLYSS